MCKRHDNTNRSSEFICLRCLSKNQVGDKMRRPNMREKDHVKNLFCLCTKLQMRTKNLEVRWCDDFEERMEYAKKIKPRYYDENNELLLEWQTENIYRKVRLINMCYKIEVQNKNAEKLNKKLDELNAPQFLRDYLNELESKNGALNYLVAIKDFLQWLIESNIIKKESICEIEVSDFNDLRPQNISSYLRYKETNGMSPTTTETRKNIIKSFIKNVYSYRECLLRELYNSMEDFSKQIKYKGISSKNNLTQKLPTKDQLNDMEEKIMWKKDECVRNRNIAIFRVLRGTGIRESELAGLDLSDLHLDENNEYINLGDISYIMVLPKGYQRETEKRPVYLTGSALKALKEWLEYRNTLDNIVDKEAVFVNKNGTRTTERNIKQIFENYGNGITPHMMRHYYASVMNQNGNLAFVQQQLGHSSVNTTVNNYANGAVGMKTVLENM